MRSVVLAPSCPHREAHVKVADIQPAMYYSGTTPVPPPRGGPNHGIPAKAQPVSSSKFSPMCTGNATLSTPFVSANSQPSRCAKFGSVDDLLSHPLPPPTYAAPPAPPTEAAAVPATQIANNGKWTKEQQAVCVSTTKYV